MLRNNGIILNAGFANICERAVFLSWDILGVDEDEWNEMSYHEQRETIEDASQFYFSWQTVRFMSYPEAIAVIVSDNGYIARRSWCGRYIGFYNGKAVMLEDGLPKEEAKEYVFTQDDKDAIDWYTVE